MRLEDFNICLCLIRASIFEQLIFLKYILYHQEGAKDFGTVVSIKEADDLFPFIALERMVSYFWSCYLNLKAYPPHWNIKALYKHFNSVYHLISRSACLYAWLTKKGFIAKVKHSLRKSFVQYQRNYLVYVCSFQYVSLLKRIAKEFSTYVN